MKQILAFGTLMVICAMLGAFFTAIGSLEDNALDRAVHAPVSYRVTVHAAGGGGCSHWAPLDEHKDCKPELCPTVEDETQMICR